MSIKTARYLALLTTLIDPAAQLRFISTGREWSFGFIIIALDLAAFNVSLLATIQSLILLAHSLESILTHLKYLP